MGGVDARRAQTAPVAAQHTLADGAGPADIAAPVDAAASLLESAARALGLSVVMLTADGRIAYASDALARLLGTPVHRLVGRPVAAALPGLNGGAAAAALARTRATGEPATARIEHVSSRGRHLFAVRAGRAADGLLAVEVQDATQSAQLEQVHARVLEAMGQAVVLVDRAWAVTYWNHAAEQLSHIDRARVVGRPLFDLWPALRGSTLEEALCDTMERRQPREVLQWHDRQRFGHRVFDVRCYPVNGDSVLVLFTEESERLRERRVLADTTEENALLRELAHQLAHTPDSATLLNVLCQVVQSACEASAAGVATVSDDGVQLLATIGHGLREPGFTYPVDGTLTERVVATRALVRERIGGGPLDTTVRRMLLPQVIGEAMVAPLVAYDEVVGVVVAVRPVGSEPFSDRAERCLNLVADHAALALWKSRLLEQALAASEAKSNFLSAMSHELRTPLTALTGYGELLADEIFGPLSGDQREMIERMRSVTQGLSAMIDELLTFSSLEAGREVIRLGEVASGDVLRAAAAAVAAQAESKGLAIELHVPEDAPLLVTDPDKLRQLLVNLAGNAVKFTEQGHVSLTLHHDEAEVCFRVEDTGIGIRSRDQARLFQPFAQLDGGLTRRYGGTGLGLYIASRLAALLHGRIEVASRPGEGSIFQLVLPRG